MNWWKKQCLYLSLTRKTNTYLSEKTIFLTMRSKNLFMKINIFNELNKYTGLGLNVGVYMDCCITDKKPILDPEYRDLEMVSHHLSKLFYLHEERIIGNMEASIEAIKVIKDIQKTVEYIGGEYKMKVREYTLKIIEKVVNND